MKSSRDRVLVGAVASALLLSQAPARAQNPASAAAEAAFQDGKRLFDAGQTHEACEKFALSQQIEAGLGTLLHLAACHEKEGKTASAWAEFNEALAQALDRGEKDREKFAREHAAALEKQLHRVVLEMMNKPEGLEIKLDGNAFPVGSLGTAIPLDPGEHQIEVKASRKKPWSQAVRLGPGAVTERIEIPALEEDPSAPALSTPPSGDRAGGVVIVQQGGTPPDPTKRWIGLGLGVAGVALGVVAAVEFGTASSRQTLSEQDAAAAGAASTPDSLRAGYNQASTDAHSQAITAQTFAYIFGATGLVALGVGVYLFATSFGSAAPPTTKGGVDVVPMVGRGTGGLSLSGSF